MKTAFSYEGPVTGNACSFHHSIRSFDIGKRQVGFTLLEVMIAVAIIGITLAVVLHTVNYHAEIMYQNTITTQMYQMAKEKMHELEKSHANMEGGITPAFTFQNRVTGVEDTEFVELTTTVTGHGKEVSLTELAVRRKDQFSGR